LTVTGKSAEGLSPRRTLITVIVPKSGGVTSTKASVVRWLKREGDRVKAGEPLVELETEKVSYELESPSTGRVVKLLAQEAAEVPVGDPLCEIEESSAKTRRAKK
jgi:pyruvate/2-oxoglutarate dehydrogenase complex dihydrolipoamide acyltransferase (E2) component